MSKWKEEAKRQRKNKVKNYASMHPGIFASKNYSLSHFKKGCKKYAGFLPINIRVSKRVEGFMPAYLF